MFWPQFVGRYEGSVNLGSLRWAIIVHVTGGRVNAAVATPVGVVLKVQAKLEQEHVALGVYDVLRVLDELVYVVHDARGARDLG